MRILLACEFSGICREAFRALGHDAVSCDLLPSELPGPHMQGDVRSMMYGGDFDMMLAFPPCTHLAVSGARYFAQKQQQQADALDFVRELLSAPIPMICVENPIGIISSRIRKPDQIVQPWYFGDDASKATCLWLKGLPLLQPSNMLEGDKHTRRANQTPSGQNKLGPSPDRWKDRSRTYPGFASAMAMQWAGQITQQSLRFADVV